MRLISDNCAFATGSSVLNEFTHTINSSPDFFTSIPKSMYWAIVTITTVGYGDIAPKTPLGQLVASLAMISGYAIIAVPTGIVSSELIRSERANVTSRLVVCPHCMLEGHQPDAQYCRGGGHRLGVGDVGAGERSEKAGENRHPRADGNPAA